MHHKFLLGASLAALVLPLGCASAQAGKVFGGVGVVVIAPGAAAIGSHAHRGGGHKISKAAAHGAGGSGLAGHPPGGTGGSGPAGLCVSGTTPPAGGNGPAVSPAVSPPVRNGGASVAGYSQPNATRVGYSQPNPVEDSQPLATTGRSSDAAELACPANADVLLHIEEAKAPLQVFVNGTLAGTVSRDATPTTMDLTSFVNGGNSRVELASRRIEDQSNLRGFLDCNGRQANVTDRDSRGNFYRQAYVLRRD